VIYAKVFIALKIHYQQNHPSICFPDDKVISNKELSALKKLVNSYLGEIDLDF